MEEWMRWNEKRELILLESLFQLVQVYMPFYHLPPSPPTNLTQPEFLHPEKVNKCFEKINDKHFKMTRI